MRDASALVITTTTTTPIYKDDRKEPCDDVITPLYKDDRKKPRDDVITPLYKDDRKEPCDDVITPLYKDDRKEPCDDFITPLYKTTENKIIFKRCVMPVPPSSTPPRRLYTKTTERSHAMTSYLVQEQQEDCSCSRKMIKHIFLNRKNMTSTYCLLFSKDLFQQ